MANTLLYRAAWGDQYSRALWGFNINPRTNRVDEYERFNRIREELYAREDAAHQKHMRMVGVAFITLALIAIWSLN